MRRGACGARGRRFPRGHFNLGRILLNPNYLPAQLGLDALRELMGETL